MQIYNDKNSWDGIRKAGLLAAKVLDYITDYVYPGVTTGKLNELCHNYIVEHGAIPACLNYKGFPKSICTSINHVVCHGIPNDRELKNGDILNIDVTVILNGWYGASSRMFFVGDVSVKARRLVQVAYDALMLAIDIIKPGVLLEEIGQVIQSYVEKNNFSVVRGYTGHGIGKIFHDDPIVFHYMKKSDIVLGEGTFFTIEPMVNAGNCDTLVSKLDGWTVTTRDKSLSAQFEHSLGITANGVEIFTLSPANFHYPPYERY